MADESVAAAWENSAPAQEELAAATPAPIVRRAVALGRQLLDPLAVLASLCGRGREVLALQLHPLQAQVRRCQAAARGLPGVPLRSCSDALLPASRIPSRPFYLATPPPKQAADLYCPCPLHFPHITLPPN